MKRVTFDDSEPVGARQAPPAKSPLACYADGCGWAGTIGDTGRFFCVAHFGAEAMQWPAITAKTAELQWWADFIADVQRMANFPRKGVQPWADYAAQFWAGADPDMAPTADEARAPSVYVYRMLGELRARALGLPRPEARKPQAKTPEFRRVRPGRAANDEAIGEVLP